MLASYPAPLLVDTPDDQPYQFHFQFHVPKHPAVPAPPQPLIPDDDNGFAFSHYIAHDHPSPSTPSLSGSLSSAGPFSAITPSSSAFPIFNAHPMSSSYSELHGLNTYFPPPQPTTPTPEHKPDKQDTKRISGACTRCKKMKMKCEFRESDPTCQRCKAGKYDCVVEGRKPRTPSQREWLLSQIRQKDATIATLLKAYNPHATTAPTPLTLASSKLTNLSPAERAAHRDALSWADKGGSGTGAGGGVSRYRMRLREREEDEDWSSESESEVWDGEVEGALAAAAAAEERGKGAGAGKEMAMYAHALPGARAPVGVLARMSLEMRRDGAGGEDEDEGEGEESEEEWGIARRGYFEPGPAANLALRRVLNERETPPAIIASGLITWRDAEKLFDIFYEYINPYLSVLDPVLHTPSSVFERCPFLFTVVCAISLRYAAPSPSRPGLHKIAMHFAKTAAGTAFVDGFKSVEMAQAYFLMGSYGVPARRWEEDRSWFYGGLASRIATDLALHRATTTKPLSERHERELLNRVRTWLICFNVDRSSSTQWGKPSSLQEDDVIRGAKEWYRRSRYNHPYDLHLVAYTELLRIMSRFHEQINSYARAARGVHESCDFKAITEATEAEVRVWHDDQQWKYTHESDPNDPGCLFRTKGLPVFENYMRLVMYSFGFQDAWNRHGVEPGDMFFAKCLSAASTVVRQLIDVYAPSGYLKYAPDCYFVMGGFCSAFLLKMLRPEFSALLDEEQRVRIVGLVERFVEVLASPEVAIDEGHTPGLYARFLHGQLKHVSGPGRGAVPVPVPSSSSSLDAPSDLPLLHASSDVASLHTASDVPALFAPSTPGDNSSAGSSVPTPGPDAWFDTWTEGSMSGSGSATAAPRGGDDDPMELCQEDQLATMQAITSDQWFSSMLMPGFRLPTEVHAQEGLWFPA